MSDGALFVESSRELPLVSISIAQRTGSLEDPPGKEGLTRLTGRLMRRTGGGLTAQQLDEQIDGLGASLGVEASHSTLAFHGTVIKRSLDAFVDLLSGVLAKPSLSEEELGRLKRETEAEQVEARDHDRSLARRWFRQRLFDGHPYGRPVSGTIASIRSVTQDDAVAFHRMTMVRGNLVFAFAGDIDADHAGRIAERLTGELPAGGPRPDAAGEPVPRPGRHLAVIDKPERTQTQILIGSQGTHPRDPDHTALHVANTIFGGTFTARMTREIRSKRGWSYGAYSSLPYDRHRRGFSLWTFPKAEDAAPCIRLELEMLEEWHDKGVTRSELDWARRYLVRSHAFALDTAAKRVALSLEEALYDLPPNYHRDYVGRVKAVTLEDANTAVAQRIEPDNLLVLVVGTDSVVGPSVREAIPKLETTEVIPYDTDG